MMGAAQSVAAEITEEKSTLYIPLHATRLASRPLNLYLSTALQPLHSTTLYNTPLRQL